MSFTQSLAYHDANATKSSNELAQEYQDLLPEKSWLRTSCVSTTDELSDEIERLLTNDSDDICDILNAYGTFIHRYPYEPPSTEGCSPPPSPLKRLSSSACSQISELDTPPLQPQISPLVSPALSTITSTSIFTVRSTLSKQSYNSNLNKPLPPRPTSTLVVKQRFSQQSSQSSISETPADSTRFKTSSTSPSRPSRRSSTAGSTAGSTSTTNMRRRQELKYTLAEMLCGDDEEFIPEAYRRPARPVYPPRYAYEDLTPELQMIVDFSEQNERWKAVERESNIRFGRPTTPTLPSPLPMKTKKVKKDSALRRMLSRCSIIKAKTPIMGDTLTIGNTPTMGNTAPKQPTAPIQSTPRIQHPSAMKTPLSTQYTLPKQDPAPIQYKKKLSHELCDKCLRRRKEAAALLKEKEAQITSVKDDTDKSFLEKDTASTLVGSPGRPAYETPRIGSGGAVDLSTVAGEFWSQGKIAQSTGQDGNAGSGLGIMVHKLQKKDSKHVTWENGKNEKNETSGGGEKDGWNYI